MGQSVGPKSLRPAVGPNSVRPWTSAAGPSIVFTAREQVAELIGLRTERATQVRLPAAERTQLCDSRAPAITQSRTLRRLPCFTRTLIQIPNPCISHERSHAMNADTR